MDIAIIDDVFKDSFDADSSRQRQKVWEWYTSVLLTRLHVNSKQIIIMTRWHEDDLIGRLLELERDEWDVVNIAVYKEDGNTIWEEKFPKEFIDRKRVTSGERVFQSLYM